MKTQDYDNADYLLSFAVYHKGTFYVSRFSGLLEDGVNVVITSDGCIEKEDALWMGIKKEKRRRSSRN